MSGVRREDGQTMDKKNTPEYHPNSRMIFTGPDYIRDHRVTVEPENRAVGVGTMSGEGTSELDYLWRAAPGTPFPRPTTSKVGEIGWGLDTFTDWSMPMTGRQVMMGEFRQELENRHAHKYQSPWYPGPNDNVDQNSYEARVMNVRKSGTPTTQQSRRQTSGTASRYWRHRGRTPAATPLYTTNILTLITSSDQKPADTTVNTNTQDNQPVEAH